MPTPDAGGHSHAMWQASWQGGSFHHGVLLLPPAPKSSSSVPAPPAPQKMFALHFSLFVMYAA